MKSLILFAVLCITVNTTFGQFSYKFLKNKSTSNALYVTGDVMVGNHNGGDLGLSFVFDKKYCVKIGFSATEKSPVSAPNDFLKSASTDVQKKGVAFENSENFYLTFGRVLFFNSKEKVRIILQGGPGITNARTPENWRWEVNNLSESVYVNDITVQKKLSLIVNPKLEFPISSVMGLSFGPMYIYSQENSFFGAGVGLIYGLL